MQDILRHNGCWLFITLLALIMFFDGLFDLRWYLMRRIDISIPNPIFSKLRILVEVENIDFWPFFSSVVTVTLREFSYENFFLKFPDVTLIQIPTQLILLVSVWLFAGFAQKHFLLLGVFGAAPALLAFLTLVERVEESVFGVTPFSFPCHPGILFIFVLIVYKMIPASLFDTTKVLFQTKTPSLLRGMYEDSQRHKTIIYWSLIVTFSAIIRNTGWLVLALLYEFVPWHRISNILHPRLPRVTQVLSGWFASTWLGLCTLSVIAKIVPVPVIATGMTLIFILQLLAGIAFFVLRRWPSIVGFMDTIDHDPLSFWPCFVLATFIIFAFGLGDSPLMPYVFQTKSAAIQSRLWLSVIFTFIYAWSCYYLVSLSKTKFRLPRIFKICFLVSFACLFIHVIFMPLPCSFELGKEYLPDNLPQLAAEMKHIHQDLVKDRVEQLHVKAERVQHGKAHGCVTAYVTLDGSLEDQTPLFQPNRTYPAFIRFSSSLHTGTSDSHSSVNGMAIKLFDVDSENFLDGTHTQDFVLISQRVFFMKDPQTYPALLSISEKEFSFLFDWIFPSWQPWTWNLEPALFVLSYEVMNLLMPTTNPLNVEYYSTTPYALSIPERPHVVKYFAKPCDGLFTKSQQLVDRQHRRNQIQTFLRDNMANFLRNNDACIEFCIQKQEEACTSIATSSLEDPTRPWLSPKIKIATIHIPKQEISLDQMEYCENLSFNPWNSVHEHRPLGAINYMRKPSYFCGSKTRLKENGVEQDEPQLKQFNLKRGTSPMGNTVEYQYDNYDGFPTLPKRIKHMAPEMYFTLSHAREMKGEQTSYQEYVKDVVTPFKRLKDFSSVLGTSFGRHSPPVLRHSWKKDEIFARQFIAGISPLEITAYDPEQPNLPAALTLDWITVKNLDTQVLKRGLTVAKLKAEERLFFVDYEILEGIPAKDESLVIYQPIALFYLNDQQELIPLAIQLTRDPHHNRIYTPADPELAWLFARMHVMQADGLVHELVHHLCFTHLVVESVIIAVNRQLPESHPVWQLLNPHFKQTIAINYLGRNTLLDGTFDKILATGIGAGTALMNKAFVTRFNFTERAFPREMASRGFYEITEGVHDNLPGYWYRDDGFAIWNAIYEYVHNILVFEYGSDSNIAKDYVLQGLKSELSDPKKANIPGVGNLDKIDSATEFLTVIIFMCSAQHQAVNAGQYDFYGFIPNRPLSISREMPDELNSVTESYIVSALPSLEQAKESVSNARVLSIEPQPSLYGLTDIPEKWKTMYNRMRHRLAVLESVIRLRAEDADEEFPPYIYLDPSKVPVSISV